MYHIDMLSSAFFLKPQRVSLLYSPQILPKFWRQELAKSIKHESFHGFKNFNIKATWPCDRYLRMWKKVGYHPTYLCHVLMVFVLVEFRHFIYLIGHTLFVVVNILPMDYGIWSKFVNLSQNKWSKLGLISKVNSCTFISWKDMSTQSSLKCRNSTHNSNMTLILEHHI